MHRWLEVGWYAPQYQKHRIREASLQFYIDIRMMFQGRINDFVSKRSTLYRFFFGDWFPIMLVSHLVVGLIISLYFFPYVIRKPLSWIISTISTLSKFKTLTELLYFIKKTHKNRPARIKTTKREGLNNPTSHGLWEPRSQSFNYGFLGGTVLRAAAVFW